MKSFFKNNLITNPQGWVEKVVGNNIRYSVFNIVSIFAGIVLMRRFFHFTKAITPYIDVYACIIGCTVILPMLYLYALRALLRKINSVQSNNSSDVK